jgi:hypothetical protein
MKSFDLSKFYTSNNGSVAARVEEDVTNDEELQQLSDDSDKYMMHELSLEIFDGTFDDFAEIVLQFGYLCFFIAAMPALAFLALCENMLQMRIDAYNLCTTYRRPHVALAEDVGMWVYLMHYMSMAGIVSNVAILCFSNSVVRNFFPKHGQNYELFLLFFVTEQGLMLLKTIVMTSISETSSMLQGIIERHQHIILKYIHGFEDHGDDDSVQKSIKGNLDDSWTPVDGLSLTDLGDRPYKMTEVELSEMEALEGKRRSLVTDLRTVKEQLQVAFKSENYNEVTGVGETKHGLPLGRLSVRILKLDQFPISRVTGDATCTVKIVAEIKSDSNKAEAVCPVFDSSMTDTAPRTLDRYGCAEFNQILGPFAPIRTHHAKVVFYVMDVNNDNSVPSIAAIATASVPFSELQDQEEHLKLLSLNVRGDANNTAGKGKETGGLTVLLSFKYSKVAPLKKKIYQLQDDIRQVEQQLAKIKTGK